MFQKLIQLGLGLSLLSLPVIEQINNPVMAQSGTGNNIPFSVKSVLPIDTSILITVLNPIAIDVKTQETLPSIAVLSAPIYDRHGRQLIPQGATVTITLKPSSKKTGKVYADSIIFGPITIPIKASSVEITGRKITQENNVQRMNRTAQLGQDVGGLLGYALTPSLKYDSHRADEYYAIGGLVGELVDLAAGEESLRIVGLRAGHTLALKLEEEAAIELPTEYPQQFPSSFNNPSYFPEYTPSVQTINNSSSSIVTPTHSEQFSRNPINLYTANQLMNLSQSSVVANSPIHPLNRKPVYPAILTRLRSFLAKNYLVEAECGTIPEQVTIRVNNEFMICGYPNTKYTPGDYSLTLDEL